MNYYGKYLADCEQAIKSGNPDFIEGLMQTGLSTGQLTQSQADSILTNLKSKIKAAKKELFDLKQECIAVYGSYSDDFIFDQRLLKNGKVKIRSVLNSYVGTIKILYPELKLNEFDHLVYNGAERLSMIDCIEINKSVNKYLDCNASLKDIELAIKSVSHQNKFNSLTDWFNALPKTNTNHLNDWLIKVCGAEDSPIVRAISRKYLIAATARAMCPGSEVHSALILYGKQGGGKTTLFKVLNPIESMYISGKVDLDNVQKATQTFVGKFIIEFGELSAMRKAELEDVKNYLTCNVDTYVPKYENLSVDVKRKMIFAGTTNHGDILSDPTGNRRFWCVKVADTLNIELLRSIKEELWAEALAAYQAGEQWHLTPEEEELLRISNDRYMEIDPIREHMIDWLAKMPETEFSAEQINDIARQYDAKIHPRKVFAIMAGLGWDSTQYTSGPKKGCRKYNRPVDSDSD